MPEVTQQQINDILASNFKVAGAMGKAAEAMRKVTVNRNRPGQGSGNSDVDRLQKDLKGRLQGLNSSAMRASEAMEDLAGDARNFGTAINRFLEGVVGGFVVARVIRGVTGMTETYQRLTEIGQTFGGSMIEMAKQAGEAGLTLDQFASLLEKASGAAAVLAKPGGGGGLGLLALEVRKNIREFGNFGLTLDQIGELSAEYAETLRLQGILRSGNEAQVAQSAAKLAQEFSEFSTLTGRSRRDLQRATNEALREVAVTSRITRGLAGDQRRGLERTTAFLSSLQGEAGDFMTRNFSQAFGFGSALFTEGVRTFVDSGFGQGISMMDRLVQQTESGRQDMGHLFQFVDDFVAEADRANESLRLQALAGNQAAVQVLRMRDQMRMLANMSHEERRRRMEDARRQQGLTQFATTFNDMISQLTGAFRAGLGDGLKNLTDNLRLMMDGRTMENLRTTLSNVGKALGGLIERVLTPANIEGFVTGVGSMVMSLIEFTDKVINSGALKTAMSFIGDIVATAKSIFFGITGFAQTVAELIAKFLNMFGGNFTAGDVGKGLATALAALIGFAAVVGALALPVLAIVAPFLLLAGAAKAVVAGLGLLATGLGLFPLLFDKLKGIARWFGLGDRSASVRGGGGATPSTPPQGGSGGPRPPPGTSGIPPTGGNPPAGGGPAQGTPRPATSAPPATPAPQNPSPPSPPPATPAQREGFFRRMLRSRRVQGAAAVGTGVGTMLGAPSSAQAADALGGMISGLAEASPLGVMAPSTAANATINALPPEMITQIMQDNQRAMERQADELQQTLTELRQQQPAATGDEQTRILRRIEELMTQQASLQTAIGRVQENIARQQLRATERIGAGGE